MGKKIIIPAIIAVLAVGCVFLLRDFKHTPSGSLYYLGKAVYTHNAELFFQYFDVQQVIEKFKPPTDQDNLLTRLAFKAFADFEQRAPEYLRKIIEDEKRPNLPGSFALLLGTQQGREIDGQMEAMLPPLSLDSRAVRFTMALYPDNTWKVVEINQSDLQWLFLGYMGINLK